MGCIFNTESQAPGQDSENKGSTDSRCGQACRDPAQGIRRSRIDASCNEDSPS